MEQHSCTSKTTIPACKIGVLHLQAHQTNRIIAVLEVQRAKQQAKKQVCISNVPI